MNIPMQDLLKQHFGYNEFLPLQEEIISTVLEKRDALVLMPTGGGKSLCYQLPAMRFEGLTLVVSPLIALMKDQVDALRSNGIPAAFIISKQPYSEINRVQQQAQQGTLKILYVAPERLALPSFQQFLAKLKVSLVAVDEGTLHLGVGACFSTRLPQAGRVAARSAGGAVSGFDGYGDRAGCARTSWNSCTWSSQSSLLPASIAPISAIPCCPSKETHSPGL